MKEKEEESEEARSIRIQRRKVRAPTLSERIEHNRTHLPYRSWCPCCVAARGTDDRHVTAKEEEKTMTTIGYDYCFLRNEAGGDYAPVLVSKDKWTKMITAHVVPYKGADVEWIREQCKRDIQKCGHYGPVTLRSDQEPAIIDLLKGIAEVRSPAESILEHSAVGDSAGNGFIERAVRCVEEMVRVLKFDLEKRLGEQVLVNSNAFAWLVEHAVDCWNKMSVGKDGKTNYERCKGKKYRGELMPFMTPVMYRVVGKVQGGEMSERWYEGLWLGQRFHTQEHLVAKVADGEVVRCRSIKELPNPITMTLLRSITGKPWAPTPSAKKIIDVKPPAFENVEPPESMFQPRGFRITPAMLERFGFTTGCRKCLKLRQGDKSRCALGHGPECRARITKAMSEDEDLKHQVEAAEERRNRYLATEVEKSAETATRIQFPKASQEPPATEEPSSSTGVSVPANEDDSEIPVPPAQKRGPEEDGSEPRAKSQRRSEDEFDAEDPPMQPKPSSCTTSSSSPGESSAERYARERRYTDETTEAVDFEPPTQRQRRACSLVASICLEEDENGEEIEMSYQPEENLWKALEPEKEFKVWNPKELQRAKQEELDRFDRMKVYEVVKREELTHMFKPLLVGVRWVLTEKQTGLKARLVAQEFATSKIDKDSLFAGTPGLAIIRCLLSRVASGQGKDYRLLVADVKTAFLYGAAKRDIYIELPPEDPRSKSGRFVGKLRKAMYGTRDAPQVWQDHLASVFLELGFVECIVTPGVYYHVEKDLEVAVHVDDLIAAGPGESAKWLSESLRKHFEMKSEILGPGRDEVQRVQYLGRTICWTDLGITIEADPKHVVKLLELTGMDNCKVVGTPMQGSDDDYKIDSEKLNAAEARKYRGATALLSYLSQDRPDLSAAVCHLARKMASPSESDVERLKRVVRYVRGVPRLIQLMEWQNEASILNLYSDSDWANCKETRKSHTGGCMFLGNHMIFHLCRIQQSVAWSSGEAELYASGRTLSTGIGVWNALRELRGDDWGHMKHHVDASACKSILLRKGAGSVKHLETKDLWVQGVVKRKGIEIVKVPRDINMSDALASYSNATDMWNHLSLMGYSAAKR